MAYYDFLNIVFAPLLKIPPLYAVIITAFIVSMIIMVITKYTTNQNLMKRLKGEMKEIQKELKELRKNPKSTQVMMEVNKKFMQTQSKYMMQSFRSMIFTFIPIIIIFGWMSSTFAFESIHPQQKFSVTALFEKNSIGDATINVVEGMEIVGESKNEIIGGEAVWFLKGNKEGEYVIEIEYDGDKQQTNVLITEGDGFLKPLKKVKDSQIKSITIGNKPKKLLNIFGWRVGWLMTYIIFSLIFTMALRKVMKVY
jgi:uncharacterized membrane protein (DUF106 family)